MKVITILVFSILLAAGFGWIMNLNKLAECDFQAPYKAEVIHTAGLFPPIGAFTGWMDFGK
jgi:hypothetical protein